MSGLEPLAVVAAVSAVVSAFHGGSELLAHIKKRRRRSSRNQAQQEFEEKQLQAALETGETQIGLRYASDMKELGTVMRVGDAIARDRLLHIAVVMQAEIIKSLQLAVKYEKAILNLNILHEASILNRKDTFVTLDELKQRILLTRPVGRILKNQPVGEQRDKRAPTHMQRTAGLPPVPDDYIPQAVSIPAAGASKGSKTGLARYFSMKRNDVQSSTSSYPRPASDASSTSTLSSGFSPALTNLLRGRSSDERATIMKDIDEIITSYQNLNVNRDKRDTWAVLNGGPEADLATLKRDTLAILNGGDNYKRNTIGLNRDALQMLRNLPPTPEETIEDHEYPAFNHSVFDPHHEQHTFDQHYASSNPQNALPPLRTQVPIQSRWSDTTASASIYSDATTPSLYRNDSASSRSHESPTSQGRSDWSPRTEVSNFFSPRSTISTAPFPPFDEYRRPRTPLNTPHAPQQQAQTPTAAPNGINGTSCHVPYAKSQQHSTPHTASPYADPQRTIASPPNATFAVPSQSHAPPIAPFAAPQRPRTPIKDENGGLKAGQTRIHLVPSQSSSRSSGSSNANNSSSSSGRNLTPSPSLTPTASNFNIPSPNPPSNSGLAIRTGTIQGPTAAQEKMMDGRPCKDNNYWGFCKGAWTVREDLKRGLGVQTRPDGMYNSHQIWQCKHCHYSGDTFFAPHPTRKNKKEVIVDPNAHVSAVGIRYRWIFLAKSHVKKKNMESRSMVARGQEREETNYGCVICSVEGNVTGIYGNVETLMNHIFLEHVRDMNEKTAAKSKCIIGRVADVNEEWDVNIPMADILLA